MDQTVLVEVIVQGGFAALFVWLLVDTSRRNEKREAALMAVIDRLARELAQQTTELKGIGAALAVQTQTLINVNQVTTHLATVAGRMSQAVETSRAEHTQILGLLGSRRGTGALSGGASQVEA
jgi:hypothetical protein